MHREREREREREIGRSDSAAAVHLWGPARRSAAAALAVYAAVVTGGLAAG